MLRRLARWRQLSHGDRWRLLGLMLQLPLVSMLLSWFGFVRTRHWLERFSAGTTARQVGAEQLRAATHLARLIEIAGRNGPVKTTCLRQSLVLYWRLRQQGFSPRLRLGVRTGQAGFDAHAWVELQGVALGQDLLLHTPFAPSDWRLSAPR